MPRCFANHYYLTWVANKDVHYGTLRGSGLFFISNPEYQILFQNNLVGAKWADYAEV